MSIWLAAVIISVVAIGAWFILEAIKLGTRYSENIERIKRGYPTLDGSLPSGYVEPDEMKDEPIRLQ